MVFETHCPGTCHSGQFADFDHYCDSAKIAPGDEGPAFGAWLEAVSGQPITSVRITPYTDEELAPAGV